MEGEGVEGWWAEDGGDKNGVAAVWSGGRVRRRWVGEWRRRELERVVKKVREAQNGGDGSEA